jgi:hypothetical protein
MMRTMTARTTPILLEHAGCLAAGTRDGWRALQFYVRDLTRADVIADHEASTWLSRTVAGAARGADRAMSWAADMSITLLLPNWRRLPSPFTQGMVGDTIRGVRDNTIVRNPLFNAYFFRAMKAIGRRCYDGPQLILEHRIDAARRELAVADVSHAEEEQAVARIMVELVEQRPIARLGAAHERFGLPPGLDPNVAIAAISCMALLYAEDGRPTADLDEEEFFMITSALMAPRFNAVSAALEKRDVPKLAQELKALRDLY